MQIGKVFIPNSIQFTLLTKNVATFYIRNRIKVLQFFGEQCISGIIAPLILFSL